jgi:1,4-alpha-glucan branching enzyme
VHIPTPRLSDQDVWLFREGTHAEMHRAMGCQMQPEGGATFAVWAPNARGVSVVADWNGWNDTALRLAPRPDGSGIWEGFSPDAVQGAVYKYRVFDRHGHSVDKADPFAFYAEHPPATGSRVWSIDDYTWNDANWMQQRGPKNALDAPMSVYELHPGSWQREGGQMLGWRELAERLAAYVVDMGFTHVELMPVAEHPFYGSWGYQVTGYFAPTARYGTPQDLMVMVDTLHQHGIGVLLDWVGSHFPSDAHALARFDGTALYEHQDPRQGFHPQWNSLIFNYGRYEVRDFLISNRAVLAGSYHFDGLRVDAVASMLYLDYAREPGEWIPNQFGGNQNLEAVRSCSDLNSAVYRAFPDVHVSPRNPPPGPAFRARCTTGGLGFGMKWNMGWMNDTLRYFAGRTSTAAGMPTTSASRSVYAFNENFVLPLSHDEVVHGKGSCWASSPATSGSGSPTCGRCSA